MDVRARGVGNAPPGCSREACHRDHVLAEVQKIMPCSKAPKICFAVTDEQLTETAGTALVASLAKWVDRPRQRARRVRLKRRRRCCRDEQLLSLIDSCCTGEPISAMSTASPAIGRRGVSRACRAWPPNCNSTNCSEPTVGKTVRRHYQPGVELRPDRYY